MWYLRHTSGDVKHDRGAVRAIFSSGMAVGGLMASPGLVRWHQGPTSLGQIKGTLIVST